MGSIRRATDDDWVGLRRVRLGALAEAPAAFGSTLAREQAFDEDAWRRWPRSSAVFLAVVDSVPVGMVAGHETADPEERGLVALWVDPAHRRNGLAAALVARVADWARADGAGRLTLWVASGNGAARRLYLECGFTDSGARKPLPSDPSVEEEQMRLLVDRPVARGRSDQELPGR
jgi:GNAT superfamily N-acetyltransferase